MTVAEVEGTTGTPGESEVAAMSRGSGLTGWAFISSNRLSSLANYSRSMASWTYSFRVSAC